MTANRKLAGRRSVAVQCTSGRPSRSNSETKRYAVRPDLSFSGPVLLQVEGILIMCRLVRIALGSFMSTIDKKTTSIPLFTISIALGIAIEPLSTSMQRLSAQPEKAARTRYPSKKMADGKQWTTQNVDVKIMSSYCYKDAEINCHQYGRLYTWESARRVCQSLGNRWRLPDGHRMATDGKALRWP